MNEMKNNRLFIDKAREFAQSAHDSINHRRKYTDEPYWVHPQRVAAMVASETDNEAVIAAAWMHDVLEDVAPSNAHFNEDRIKHEFGQTVLDLVLEVTDVSRPEDGNRLMRKAIDRKHLAQASNYGKLIKLADMIDNVIDIDKHDPGFSKVFRREVSIDLERLRSGSEALYLRLVALLVGKP